MQLVKATGWYRQTIQKAKGYELNQSDGGGQVAELSDLEAKIIRKNWPRPPGGSHISLSTLVNK